MLCLEAVVPAPEGVAAEQAVAAIMDHAGVLDGFDDAQFVGEPQQRGGGLPPLRTVRFRARTREQCVQLFRTKRAGIGKGRFVAEPAAEPSGTRGARRAARHRRLQGDGGARAGEERGGQELADALAAPRLRRRH